MTPSWNAPEHVRYLLRGGLAGPLYLKKALGSLGPEEREPWWDRVLHGDPPDDLVPDDRDLPEGSAPYMPCAIETVVRTVELLAVGPHDVVVDVGSGLGRTTSLVRFLSNASVIGIEIQKHLVERAAALETAFPRDRNVTLLGDAAELLRYLPLATVYFLYCPCGGTRLQRILSEIEYYAARRDIRVACVDMAPLKSSFLVPLEGAHHSLRLYRSRPRPLRGWARPSERTTR